MANYINDPDRGLVEKAQSGSAKALRKLIEKYYEMVFAVTYGVLNQREDAQDVTQEVLLRLPKDIERFQGRSKFKTWLYRVAVNQAISYIRKRKPVTSVESLERFESGAKSPLQEAAGSERELMVREALNALSPEHRAILVLREWEGLSYEDISEMLEISLGTVMSRLHYARKKLETAVKAGFKGMGKPQ